MSTTRTFCALSGAILTLAVTSYAGAATVEDAVVLQLARSGRADVFVEIASRAQLDAAAGIAERTARRQYVYDTLNAHAAATQAGVLTLLARSHLRYESFWIDNSIYVSGADAGLVEALAALPEVGRVRANRAVQVDGAIAHTRAPHAPAAVEPNIARINADDVWALGNTGQGVVVASIDTGVRYTHEALRAQYRGNNGDGTFSHDYNWWDPRHGLAAPADNVSHGTHLLGIAVGGDALGPLVNDIGVAPGARWIAAKGCESVSCSEFSLISAAQWVACPTRVDGSAPDCSKAPDVVDNGWGGGGGNDWFQTYVDAWRAAGIIPVFSVGASGPNCRTVGSPADYRNVIGVGATDNDDVLMSFSSRGPGMFRPLKPDLVAPGDSIRSAAATGDAAYVIFSGTSMATSHVTGTAALVLSAQPGASFGQVLAALARGAERDLGATSPDSCAGRRYDVFPNFIYGRGRVDAAGAVGAGAGSL